MASRFCFVLICVMALTGCYTQIRAPRVEEEHSVKPVEPPKSVIVQQFEYYNQNITYDYCDPFASRAIPTWTICFPDRYPRDPYRRYPYWIRNQLIWDYSCWATVYDPWWRGYPLRVVVPRVIYASVPREIASADHEDLAEQRTPRPNPRPGGMEGVPQRPPRTTSTQRPTTTRTNQPKSSTSSTKTQPSQQKKKDEEEKREEKRTERRRRGGMR